MQRIACSLSRAAISVVRHTTHHSLFIHHTTMHFYDLLTDLYESYTPEKAEETIAFIRKELSFEVLYQHDGQTLQTLINDQHEDFYGALARELVADLNKDAIRYFLDWQPLLSLFDRRSIQLLYAAGVQRAGTTEAGYCLQGLQALDNDRPEDALFFFHSLSGAMRHYFAARCYAAMQLWENALRQYDEFFETTIDSWMTVNDEKAQDDYFLMAQWHAYKELGYCTCRLGRYEDARMNYELAFEYINIGNIYIISQGRTGSDAQFFHTMVSHYLLALEKTGHYDTALELVAFALQHYPADAFYTSVKKRCEAAMGQQDFASQLLTQVFQPEASLCAPATMLATTPEKALAQLIIAQLQQGGAVFQKRLRVYEERFIYGQHYYVADAGCFVNLLLEEEATGTLYAVNVAAQGAGPAVVDQLEHCIEALAVQLERDVKGILCLFDADDQLSEWVSADGHIEVYSWQLGFRSLS